MVPGAAIAFGQAITAPKFVVIPPLPPELGIALPKPLGINILGTFHGIRQQKAWFPWKSLKMDALRGLHTKAYYTNVFPWYFHIRASFCTNSHAFHVVFMKITKIMI